MTTITTLASAAALALTLGAQSFAQEHVSHDDHADHAMRDPAAPHDHDHDHGDDHAMHKADAEADAAAPALAAGRTITAKVHGMVCDFCARSLTKVLSKKDAVEAVAIDLSDKTVTIVLKDGARMDDAEVEKAILDAGYNLAELTRA